jgi:hypothetical protein
MNTPENTKSETPGTNTGEIILYQPDDAIRLEVRVENETVWLTQSQMAELFGRDRTVIGRHIRNIFSDTELQEDEVCANFAHTTKHGAIKRKTQTTDILSYNLDMIISVGYRVKSKQGIQFRRWATRILKEYLLRGFVIGHRIERIEKLAVETGQRVTENEKELSGLKQHVEAIIADYNDINEDTRLQLELINETLAELQSKNQLNRPRNPIGFKIDS